jgi:hypothetical protein
MGGNTVSRDVTKQEEKELPTTRTLLKLIPTSFVGCLLLRCVAISNLLFRF